MNTSRLLSSVGRHIKLTDEEKEIFLGMLDHRELKPGDFLLKEGETCRYIAFVLEGCMKTYQVDEQGTEHITDFLIEEWWADDLYSFLTETPSRFYIQAIEKTNLARISASHLRLLYQQVPRFEKYFRILFQNAYVAQKRQINAMLSASAEERYKSFLLDKPYAEERFQQKDIASYLGVTPQFLSTLRKKLRRLNLD